MKNWLFYYELPPIVILLHFISWKKTPNDAVTPQCHRSIHIKDESKCGIAFAFIFGVNWLWRCGDTASFGVFFQELNVTKWQVSWNWCLVCVRMLPTPSLLATPASSSSPSSSFPPLICSFHWHFVISCSAKSVRPIKRHAAGNCSLSAKPNRLLKWMAARMCPAASLHLQHWRSMLIKLILTTREY